MDFKKLLKEAIKNNTKIIITGRSGWGKSEMIQQVADELGYELIDFRLSEVLPEDLVGIPKLRDDYYDYVPPRWLYDVVNNPDKKYLLFLDEITQGTPEVLNICYKIFDKVTKIGNFTLENVAVVGATNYSDESNYLSELPLPLRNRACNLELDHDSLKAAKYLVDKYNLTSKEGSLITGLRNIIELSNPRSVEKSIQLLMNDASKELIIPYIGNQNFSQLSSFLKTTQRPTTLTDLEEALYDIKQGFISLNGKQYAINDVDDLKYTYPLTDEEIEIVQDKLMSTTLNNVGLQKDYLTYKAASDLTITGEHLEKLCKCRSFNPLEYIKRMKLTPETLTNQFESLKAILNLDEKQLLRRFCSVRIIPLHMMKTYRENLPWDILLKSFERKEFTKDKEIEFAKELATEIAKRGN